MNCRRCNGCKDIIDKFMSENKELHKEYFNKIFDRETIALEITKSKKTREKIKSKIF